MELVILVGSILLSAFFSGTEIAFISANKIHLELEKKREGLAARFLVKITRNPSKFITSMVVGNNVVLVIYSMYMAKYLSPFLSDMFNTLIIKTIISTLIILVTAEFLPKVIFTIYANQIFKYLAVPAYIFYCIFGLVSSLITSISDFLLKYIFKVKKQKRQTEFSKEELGNYISEQMEYTLPDDKVDTEIQIFQNALEFDTLKSREVMIPRTEINAVDIDESIDVVRKTFIETGYSKLIVYVGSLDNIIGYVHAFEMFKSPKNIRSILLPVELIPGSMIISDVLKVLTKKKKSIAVVLDEYGGTSGMITVEDIVEELFGEIEDEHDTINLHEKQVSKNIFEFSARLEVDYINDKYHLQLPKEVGYETIGGLIVNYYQKIPKKNVSIKVDNYHFLILEVSSNKIEKVKLTVIDKKNR